MGNTPPSSHDHKDPPRKPFAPWNKRSCITKSILPVTLPNKPSPLQTLILLQDWQRVLCRVKLYPAELTQFFKLGLSADRILKVLPLHLVCALDPPLAVVQLMLELSVDATTKPVRPVRPVQRRLGARYQSWRQTRVTPKQEPTASYDEVDDADQSLLGPPSGFFTASQGDADPDGEEGNDELEDDASAQSSISSRHSLPDKKVILQLSPTGGLQPMPVNSDRTDETSQMTDGTIFRVHWDLDPLFEHVFSDSNGCLLALHVACFYSASPKVIEAIVRAYPTAALHDVIGMLPIHWVAAGWTLPPLFPPASSSQSILSLPSLSNKLKEGPLETLKVLKQAVPDSVRVRSGNHGMTPHEYIQECMEDCNYKESCLLLADDRDFFLDNCSCDESIIFSSDTSSNNAGSPHKTTTCNICELVTDHDWEGILAAIEANPALASQWIYGMDASTQTVWRRLPIHLVCAEGGPVGLLNILLQSYGPGVSCADPKDGSTPLHIVCRSHATLNCVKLLLQRHPQATQYKDNEGKIPLHVALSAKSSYSVIERIVEEDPASVSVKDNKGFTPIDVAKSVYGDKHILHELLTMVQVYLKND